MPFLTTAKPLTLSSLRAFWHATIQGDFLPKADLVLLTILPDLFFTKSPLVIPDAVLLSLPAKRWRLASLKETGFFFMALIAFMAAMAFMAFMVFMALAILDRWEAKIKGESSWSLL